MEQHTLQQHSTITFLVFMKKRHNHICFLSFGFGIVVALTFHSNDHRHLIGPNTISMSMIPQKTNTIRESHARKNNNMKRKIAFDDSTDLLFILARTAEGTSKVMTVYSLFINSQALKKIIHFWCENYARFLRTRAFFCMHVSLLYCNVQQWFRPWYVWDIIRKSHTFHAILYFCNVDTIEKVSLVFAGEVRGIIQTLSPNQYAKQHQCHCRQCCIRIIM